MAIEWVVERLISLLPTIGNIIRIYGAGYWRKGRKIYEDQKNTLKSQWVN